MLSCDKGLKTNDFIGLDGRRVDGCRIFPNLLFPYSGHTKRAEYLHARTYFGDIRNSFASVHIMYTEIAERVEAE